MKDLQGSVGISRVNLRGWVVGCVLATCFLFLRYFYVYNPIEKLSLKGYNYNVCIVQLKMIHSVFLLVIGGV